jgi:hypothetical protein
MNETVQIGRWVLRPDVARTLAAHAQLTKSGAAECTCTGCANFEAVRQELLAGPLGEILERLGISPPWEVEAYELGRASSGLHHYGGWFHFVGTIESGSGAWRPMDDHPDVRTADFEHISPTLSIGFHTDVVLVRPPFTGFPLVQLEISVELPWVITAEEPM